MKLALKIDVGTYRGTRDGVPRLLELLKRHQAGATFLFSLGHDQTGRAIRRAFRPGFMAQAARTSMLAHHGTATLLYGTLLPAPDIGRRCADILKRVRDAGFEVGIHAWNRAAWQNNVAAADAEWTARQMQLACDRFEQIFGTRARVHGAAGWQMNAHAWRLTQRLGFDYCSDTRGTCPYIPVRNAEIIACPQLPTTLPTLHELMGTDGLNADNVADHLLALSGSRSPAGHVYTLRAELEGMTLAPVFERLLNGWRDAGFELVSLRDYFAALEPRLLPRHTVIVDAASGRTGNLAVQGGEFLASTVPALPG